MTFQLQIDGSTVTSSNNIDDLFKSIKDLNRRNSLYSDTLIQIKVDEDED